MNEKRIPVWHALSEFYLDTELDDGDFDRIAAVLMKSGFTLEEAKQIDLYEVFPLLQPNLLSVAGEWTGFDEKWLNENCEKLYGRRNSRFFRGRCVLWNKFFYWMRRRYWEQIEKRME
ncbi:MAG: hypothetical protein H7Z75_01250 [Ferruginibacter sp.]|nr:hypothetical protein [Cytophagales bacterium]